MIDQLELLADPPRLFDGLPMPVVRRAPSSTSAGRFLSGLGDAGGSGTFVFDEIVPELTVTPEEYPGVRRRVLEHMGLIPRTTAATPDRHGSFGPGHAWTVPGVPAHEATPAEINAALQMSEWYPPWWANRPAGVGVTGGSFKDIYVNLPPGGPPVAATPAGYTGPVAARVNRPTTVTFRAPFVEDVYGPSPVHWVDLPGPPYVVLVPFSNTWLHHFAVVGAPVYEVPLWKAWGGSCDTIQNACSRTTQMMAVPSRRIGVSTGDRHGFTLLRNPNGTPYGWIGRYEPGGSGNFFMTPEGQFLAREVAAAIVEVVIIAVGTVITAGFGTGGAIELGIAAGRAVSGAIGDEIASSTLPSIIPTAVREAPVPVQFAVGLEVANRVNPVAVQNAFAQIALVSTYFVGLDNFLLGLGSLLRMMAVDLQSDPHALGALIAQRQAALAQAGGQLMAIAVQIVQVVGQIVLTVATGGVAAPYLAALHAVETALAAAHDGSNQAALRSAGLGLLQAAAAFVPVVGGVPLGSLLSTGVGAGRMAAAGDLAHAGATLGETLAALIPGVGRALASAGAAAVAIADGQDALRRATTLSPAQRLAAANHLADHAVTVTSTATHGHASGTLPAMPTMTTGSRASASTPPGASTPAPYVSQGLLARFRALTVGQKWGIAVAAVLGLAAAGGRR